MFKIKEKFERSLSKRRSKSISVRLFRSNTGSHSSIVGLERANQEDFYADFQKVTRNAMLGAEREKGMAIMALEQQNQRFC